MKPIPEITVDSLLNLQAESSALVLLDVREADEFAATRTSFGRNVPLSLLESEGRQAIRKLPDSEPVFVICRSGKRSSKAAQLLATWGLTNVTNVTGGMLAWEAAGLPVTKS